MKMVAENKEDLGTNRPVVFKWRMREKKTELMLKLKRYRHTQLEAVQVDPTTSSTCFHGSLSSCFGKETFSNEEERRP